MYKISIYIYIYTLSKLHVRRKEKAAELQMEAYLAIKDEEGKKNQEEEAYQKSFQREIRVRCRERMKE